MRPPKRFNVKTDQFPGSFHFLAIVFRSGLNLLKGFTDNLLTRFEDFKEAARNGFARFSPIQKLSAAA